MHPRPGIWGDAARQHRAAPPAPSRPAGQAIDRPLFSDFWERFTGSLAALRAKRQRTVYRLTLVAGWNITEAAGRARRPGRVCAPSEGAAAAGTPCWGAATMGVSHNGAWLAARPSAQRRA